MPNLADLAMGVGAAMFGLSLLLLFLSSRPTSFWNSVWVYIFGAFIALAFGAVVLFALYFALGALVGLIGDAIAFVGSWFEAAAESSVEVVGAILGYSLGILSCFGLPGLFLYAVIHALASAGPGSSGKGTSRKEEEFSFDGWYGSLPLSDEDREAWSHVRADQVDGWV